MADPTMQDFFEALYPEWVNSPEGYFLEIRKLPGGAQAWCQNVEEALHACEKTEKNVYFGVSLRDTREGTEDRSKYVSALWVDIDWKDLDGGREEAVRIIQAFELLPSITVSSGNGFHLYWLLREPEIVETEAQLKHLRRLLYGVSQALGGDPTARDLSRILRVPGTLNRKDPKNLKPVEISSWHPERRYNLTDFEDWAEDEPAVDRAGNGRAEPLPDRVAEGGRNNMLTSLAGTMRRRGATEPEIRAALLAANEHRCDPPLPENEVLAIARSAMRYTPEEAADPTRPFVLTHGIMKFPLTDLGNAERIVRRCGNSIRYCYAWKSWLVWDGKRWCRDAGSSIQTLAQETVRAIRMEASVAEDEDEEKAIRKFAVRSESDSKIKAMLSQAQSMVAIDVEELDEQPWMLNVNNGTLDLRTGELHDHLRESMLTQLCPVDYVPDADCPQWLDFLRTIMCGREELVVFLQKAMGYALTGSTNEQVFFVLHGHGQNGKSTFLDVIRTLLGDYACHTPAKTLMEKRQDGVPNDIARLKGARFVDAVETKKGGRLDESLVKELTGGERITARFLNQEFFEFQPQFKLFLASNHKPQIKGTDYAIWRRVRLIPFSYRVPEDQVVKDLPERLKGELSGILNWALDGCRLWQSHGLVPPQEITGATDLYRAEMDVMGAFFEECCVVGQGESVLFTDLYNAYTDWCTRSGERPFTKRAMGLELTERGFENHKGAGGAKMRMGISLADSAVARGRVNLSDPSFRYDRVERTEEPDDDDLFVTDEDLNF